MEVDYDEFELRTGPREKLVPLIRDRSNFERAISACNAYNDRDGRFYTDEMLWGSRPIPTDQNIHFFGHLTKSRIYFVRGTTDGVELESRPKTYRQTFRQDCPRAVTFHSQPLRKHYSDIPSDEDLLRFLKFQHRRHVLIGRRSVSIFEKSLRTLELTLDLWEWEQSHPYRMSRLLKRKPEKARIRYASSALRGIGLHWPYRIAEKRKLWPRILRDLGIVVTITNREESGTWTQNYSLPSDTQMACSWHQFPPYRKNPS